MRVRVVKTTVAYWNYSVQTLNPPEEVDGDFARHLADNAPAGSVEVIEDDRGKARKAAAPPAPPAAPADPGAGGTPPPAGGSPDGTPPAGDTPPVDGTIDDLMKWIADDKDRAVLALDAEQAKDKPRSTVVKRLTALTEADTETE